MKRFLATTIVLLTANYSRAWPAENIMILRCEVLIRISIGPAASYRRLSMHDDDPTKVEINYETTKDGVTSRSLAVCLYDKKGRVRSANIGGSEILLPRLSRL